MTIGKWSSCASGVYLGEACMGNCWVRYDGFRGLNRCLCSFGVLGRSIRSCICADVFRGDGFNGGNYDSVSFPSSLNDEKQPGHLQSV